MIPSAQHKEDRPPLQTGVLYLVATPIGNLEDITLRAIRTLQECDIIAAEDTRRAGLLLKHLGISKPIFSCFEFNEMKRAAEIVEKLRAGQKIALITDAGTPGISDPGQRVVSAVINAGLKVEPVPGPCALIAALTASGLPTDEFHFIGFLPHKQGKRHRTIENLKNVPGTLIFYESPFRVIKLIEELAQIMPERKVVLAREITKRFEEYIRGYPNELLEILKSKGTKGEYIVLVAPEEKK
ncbi:MAG TPA: 16S rRNA (cytidine(1402)-2'-O)-methyltransferase [Verrucomicrobiota bacterium]|nr:16S rRNA (cytidine(1402)-2'-O)-methyltransferase [Verrucomicrobiota bacterium]